jgi:pilus assembly protein Flp/PilA
MLKFLIYLQNLLAEPLRGDDRGVTAVEYGLIVAGIAALIVATVFVLGRTLNGVFANINGLI